MSKTDGITVQDIQDVVRDLDLRETVKYLFSLLEEYESEENQFLKIYAYCKLNNTNHNITFTNGKAYLIIYKEDYDTDNNDIVEILKNKIVVEELQGKFVAVTVKFDCVLFKAGAVSKRENITIPAKPVENQTTGMDNNSVIMQAINQMTENQKEMQQKYIELLTSKSNNDLNVLDIVRLTKEINFDNNSNQNFDFFKTQLDNMERQYKTQFDTQSQNHKFYIDRLERDYTFQLQNKDNEISELKRKIEKLETQLDDMKEDNIDLRLNQNSSTTDSIIEGIRELAPFVLQKPPVPGTDQPASLPNQQQPKKDQTESLKQLDDLMNSMLMYFKKLSKKIKDVNKLKDKFMEDETFKQYMPQIKQLPKQQLQQMVFHRYANILNDYGYTPKDKKLLKEFIEVL